MSNSLDKTKTHHWIYGVLLCFVLTIKTNYVMLEVLIIFLSFQYYGAVPLVCELVFIFIVGVPTMIWMFKQDLRSPFLVMIRFEANLERLSYRLIVIIGYILISAAAIVVYTEMVFPLFEFKNLIDWNFLKNNLDWVKFICLGVFKVLLLSLKVFTYDGPSCLRYVQQLNAMRKLGIDFPYIHVSLSQLLTTSSQKIIDSVIVTSLFVSTREQVKHIKKTNQSLSHYSWSYVKFCDTKDLYFLNHFFFIGAKNEELGCFGKMCYESPSISWLFSLIFAPFLWCIQICQKKLGKSDKTDGDEMKVDLDFIHYKFRKARNKLGDQVFKTVDDHFYSITNEILKGKPRNSLKKSLIPSNSNNVTGSSNNNENVIDIVIQ